MSVAPSYRWSGPPCIWRRAIFIGHAISSKRWTKAPSRELSVPSGRCVRHMRSCVRIEEGTSWIRCLPRLPKRITAGGALPSSTWQAVRWQRVICKRRRLSIAPFRGIESWLPRRASVWPHFRTIREIMPRRWPRWVRLSA